MQINKIPILIPTCEKHSVLLPLLLLGIRKNCPWLEPQMNLLSSGPQVGKICYMLNFRGVVTAINPDQGFSGNLVYCLKNLESRYVVTWVDDRIPTAPMQFDLFRQAMVLLTSNKADYIKLIKGNPIGRSPRRTSAVWYGQSIGRSKYGLSLTIAGWRSEFLLSALMSSKSPWDMERRSHEIIAKYSNVNRIYGVARSRQCSPSIHDVHMIVQGKLFNDAKLREGRYLQMIRRRFARAGPYLYIKHVASNIKNILIYGVKNEPV